MQGPARLRARRLDARAQRVCSVQASAAHRPPNKVSPRQTKSQYPAVCRCPEMHHHHGRARGDAALHLSRTAEPG